MEAGLTRLRMMEPTQGKFFNKKTLLIIYFPRYFAKYTGKGRYSVKCQVSGDDETGVNNGFTSSRVFPRIPDPHSPLCCGSDAMPPGAKTTPTGNFTRLILAPHCMSVWILKFVERNLTDFIFYSTPGKQLVEHSR